MSLLLITRLFPLVYTSLSFLFLSLLLFVLKGAPGQIGEFGLHGLSGAPVSFKRQSL